MDQVYQASVVVIQNNGVLLTEYIPHDQYWDNWSLDALATPRINSYFDQVERLPGASVYQNIFRGRKRSHG